MQVGRDPISQRWRDVTIALELGKWLHVGCADMGPFSHRFLTMAFMASRILYRSSNPRGVAR